MFPTKEQVILGTLAQFGREQILTEWEKDSCIASTGIALDILKHYEIPARPMCVTTMIFNAAAYAKIIEIGRLPNPEESKAWQAEVGGWSVGLGFGERGGPKPNKWAGHLVAIVRDQILLDLSIDQATRPQHNIFLQAGGGCIENAAKFLSGEQVFVTGSNGCLLIYERKNNEDYQKSPDWLETHRRKRVLFRTIQEIDKQVEEWERAK